MATHANIPVTDTLQAPISGDYFTRTYRHLCEQLTALEAFPADAPDDAIEAAQVEADQTFHSILTARVTALPQLALKLRAMMQREKDAMHSHGGDDGTVRNYAMLAADLDCLITMQDAAGKAVRS